MQKREKIKRFLVLVFGCPFRSWVWKRYPLFLEFQWCWWNLVFIFISLLTASKQSHFFAKTESIPKFKALVKFCHPSKPCGHLHRKVLSGESSASRAKSDLVKIQNLFFSYWAWSSPWGHVLSLKTFRQIPVLSWAIRYSVFQPVNSLIVSKTGLAIRIQLFDIWWSSLDINNDFKAISRTAFFRFGEICQF